MEYHPCKIKCRNCGNMADFHSRSHDNTLNYSCRNCMWWTMIPATPGLEDPRKESLGLVALRLIAKEQAEITCPADQHEWDNCPAHTNGGNCPDAEECWLAYYLEKAEEYERRINKEI